MLIGGNRAFGANLFYPFEPNPPQDDTPIYINGLNQFELLQLAALAAKWHEPARDALDRLVLECEKQDLHRLDVYEQVDYMPFDPTIKRTEGTVRHKETGEVFKVGSRAGRGRARARGQGQGQGAGPLEGLESLLGAKRGEGVLFC